MGASKAYFLRVWRPETDEIVRSMWGKHTPAEIAQAVFLRQSADAEEIYQQERAAGLPKPDKGLCPCCGSIRIPATGLAGGGVVFHAHRLGLIPTEKERDLLYKAALRDYARARKRGTAWIPPEGGHGVPVETTAKPPAATRVRNMNRYAPDDPVITQGVYVGRAGHGQDGYFGNPIRPGRTCPECRGVHHSGGGTLPCFARALFRRLVLDREFRGRVSALRGRDLLCFCDPDPCHARYLACAADGGIDALRKRMEQEGIPVPEIRR